MKAAQFFRLGRMIIKQVSTKRSMENGCFLKTKSPKIDPKVPYRPSRPLAKIGFSGRNPNFWAQKKLTLLN